jgi:DNA-binding NarL/FixJ family response regulator
MRVLVIDDCEITLESVRVFLETEIPGVDVTEYWSLQLGKPGRDFDWTAYDVLLLDYDLGNGQTGVEWLRPVINRPGFPPTVLITGVADSYVVADAIKMGIAGYLNKADMTPEHLVEAVYEVLAHPTCDARSAPISAYAAGSDTTSQSFATDRPPEWRNGIANYRFAGTVGRGIFLTVYKAERIRDGLIVAIKVLDRSVAHTPENVQRFTREGELVSWVESPYVVDIFEQGLTNRYGYIVMEYFEGGDLNQRIAQGLAPEQVIEYLRNIASGLQAIHEVGVVHRNLKPANVMFRRDGSLALVDFGVAKRIGASFDLTNVGTVMGTPYYVSPEQARGMAADEQSDLYSLGLMFYEMLTGTRPYLGETMSALLFQHIHAPVPDLPSDVARFQPLLAGLMAKEQKDRFSGTSDLFRALAAFDE